MMKVISRVIGFGFCGAGFLWDWRGWTRVSEVGGGATGVRLRATLADRKSKKKVLVQFDLNSHLGERWLERSHRVTLASAPCAFANHKLAFCRDVCLVYGFSLANNSLALHVAFSRRYRVYMLLAPVFF
jgi:hypothetical protein